MPCRVASTKGRTVSLSRSIKSAEAPWAAIWRTIALPTTTPSSLGRDSSRLLRSGNAEADDHGNLGETPDQGELGIEVRGDVGSLPVTPSRET